MNTCTIRGRKLLPIIQGGMGVGVSLGRLAGSVAACGGMGVISAAHPGYTSPDFWQHPLRENIRELKSQIAIARGIAGRRGMVGVNIMVAATQYAELATAVIEAGADAIISGAGVPLELPGFAGAERVALAPIVSSGKAARIICGMWERRHNRLPDFIVLEGPQAGGHLGFEREQLLSGSTQQLDALLADVLAAIEPYKEKAGRDIPVFVAGGIRTGAEIAHYQKQGAAGVQMATGFIATHECDVSEGFKNAITNAADCDITIIQSPVGMPGRALRSPLIENLERVGRIPVTHCINCLRTCDPATTPYCISSALIEAAKGNWEDGLFFCGSPAGTVSSVVPVAEYIERLVGEWEAAQ